MVANVKRVSKCPCKGCTERWVSEQGRCHSTCERYAEWKGEVDAAAQTMRDEINRTKDADFIFAEKCLKYKKAVRRCPKKGQKA